MLANRMTEQEKEHNSGTGGWIGEELDARVFSRILADHADGGFLTFNGA